MYKCVGVCSHTHRTLSIVSDSSINDCMIGVTRVKKKCYSVAHMDIGHQGRPSNFLYFSFNCFFQITNLTGTKYLKHQIMEVTKALISMMQKSSSIN